MRYFCTFRAASVKSLSLTELYCFHILEGASEIRTLWYVLAWFHRSRQVVANRGSEGMKCTRRNHGATCTEQVVLAELNGDTPLAELAEQFRVHPTQITSCSISRRDRTGRLTTRGQIRCTATTGLDGVPPHRQKPRGATE